MAKGTGARGLRAIMEKLMVELMFELPSRKDIEKVVINEEVVKNGTLLPFLERDAKEEQSA